MSVDPKVYELASAFLSEVKGATEDDKLELAQDIQLAIENFIEFHQSVAAVNEHPSPL